jgi:hypothetical protein
MKILKFAIAAIILLSIAIAAMLFILVQVEKKLEYQNKQFQNQQRKLDYAADQKFVCVNLGIECK